jgi:hypothetical protein
MNNADTQTKYLQFVFTLCKGHKPVITSVLNLIKISSVLSVVKLADR